MRILAFSDIHGNVKAVRKLVSEISEVDFDMIIFGGDFTNTWFDGLEEGNTQMREIAVLIQSLDRPFYYVYGNRDYSQLEGIVECTIGKNIGEMDWVIGDYTLTNKIDGLDGSKILVTHALHRRLKARQANALLYLYGHDHIGRVYKNYIDLGFLYRSSKTHGAAQSLLGCYWFIDIENDEFYPENNSWQLKKSNCSIHKNQGTFYIPFYWKRDCPLCYEEKQNKLDF